ncbi:uncharacterized protein B0H18DRAFT_1124684 [Fomitopsis serialis]|uniref:uncharacterized protein n=1 Tax=Fomitopsis serialis TaxID=139415 RepID=UPI00200781CD|nr:uncharacterized protein B0H18DRAFT_1124684 [Neoantrodia serialis]KAH9915732.1 hypothetical protein B0H18DRAFT_1124684 [Neoantrodia serialis]
MAHYVSPRKAGVRNHRPVTKHDTQQGSRKNQLAWKSEIAGKIVLITNPVAEFLEHFVPGEKPLKSVTKAAFQMPKNARLESEMYGPLCEGFTSLVRRFDRTKKPVFVNHNHDRIGFPYKLCASEHHVTRPDVIASFPGEESIGRHADYWRNISFVVEVKLAVSDDPMKSYSDAHEATLVQLSKSARNLLVSQSRLFVFVIGVYGPLARIFRFDHAGAVCSDAFDYTTLDGSRLLHEFLWRFTHPPPHSGCRVVGDDPTVQLVRAGQCAEVVKKLRDAGVTVRNTPEASKIYRYVTVGSSEGKRRGTKYLVYDLLFINPHLFSRATTVWEAIEVDGDNKPVKTPVVIKDSWRQMVRQLETDNYREIFRGRTDIPGVAAFVSGEDLGTKEILSLQRGEPGGQDVGHLTVTARHSAKNTTQGTVHAYNERSHVRLVLGTVGIPLSRFNSTHELVEALRDAILGHRAAYEAGVMHRDISEGNVMISRNPNDTFKGYIQDFDYGLNWAKLLEFLKHDTKLEDWDAFVQSESAKLKEARREALLAALRTQPEPDWYADEDEDEYADSHASAAPDEEVGDDHSGDEYDDTDHDGDQVEKWTSDDDEQEEVEIEDAPEGVDLTRHDSVYQEASAPQNTEEMKQQCKQRTGTLFFMAVRIIRGGIVHEARHDLESFFWLLLWIVLRHTVHNHPNGVRACEVIFDGDSDAACESLKTAWLNRVNEDTGEDTGPALIVFGNEPLTTLLEDFRMLCLRSNSPMIKMEPLTYESVLAVFEKALAMDWPLNDKARAFVLPRDDDKTLRPKDKTRPTSDVNSSKIQSSVVDPGGLAPHRCNKKRWRKGEEMLPQQVGVAVGSDRSNIATRRNWSQGPSDPSGRGRTVTAAKVVLLQPEGDVPHGDEELSAVPEAQGRVEIQRTWKGRRDTARSIVPITNPVEEFLHHFTAGEQPPRSVAKRHTIHIPTNVKHANSLYGTLHEGFTSLVSEAKRLAFVNHNYHRIKSVGDSHLFHEILWRFTHTVQLGCGIIGVNPILQLQIRPAQRAEVVTILPRDAGLNHADTHEATKAYHYTTNGSGGRKKKYLVYELIFIKPHLFSRATMVLWEAIEVDAGDRAVGGPVVVKVSWRQLARQEIDNYEFIAWASVRLPGVAEFCGGEDLGAAGFRALKRGKPGGQGVGHLTVTARHRVYGNHAKNERSHSRMILCTVGVGPLSRFQSTKELVQALRDAIGGVMHRDISEGNVMFSRVKHKSTGYLQDLDCGLNWKMLLKKLGLGIEMADWDAFVRDECANFRVALKEKHKAKVCGRQARQNDGDSNGSLPLPPPRTMIRMTPRTIPQVMWLQEAMIRARIRMTPQEGDPACGDDEEDELEPGPSGVALTEQDGARQNVKVLSAEELKLQCKQRTGTLYFMAVEIISGGIIHEIRHDLESFYWLLVWIVLRYCDHDHDAGTQAYAVLFGANTDSACEMVKRGWVTGQSPVVVYGNKPLNRLLERFRKLCKYNDSSNGRVKPLTYNKVLRILDDALSRKWPSRAKAAPYVFPKQDEGVSLPAGSARHASTLDSSRRVRSDALEPVTVYLAGHSGQSRRTGSARLPNQGSGGDLPASGER